MKSIDQIRKILAPGFEVNLFDAALGNLNDSANKLRYNNFAYAVRELSRNFLHRLAPDINVRNCKWYKPEADTITRSQRIKYAIQGGITDHILTKWGFDVDELHETIREIKLAIDSLNKYTHIEEGVFDIDQQIIDKNSKRVLKAFETFVFLIDDYRNEMKSFLDGEIEQHMIDTVISTFFENVDMLAPHHSLNYCTTEEYHISEINDHEIVVDVSGYISVTLEYGSRQERRDGDGLDLDEDFAFETKIRYEIEDDFPSERYEVDPFDADTSTWYE